MAFFVFLTQTQTHTLHLLRHLDLDLSVKRRRGDAPVPLTGGGTGRAPERGEGHGAGQGIVTGTGIGGDDHHARGRTGGGAAEGNLKNIYSLFLRNVCLLLGQGQDHVIEIEIEKTGNQRVDEESE